MRLIILALSVLTVLAVAIPATADPVLNGPCANPNGLPVVTTATDVTADVETPWGVLGVGEALPGGTYLVDLEGVEVGLKKTVSVTLSWTNGIFDELTDYDMVIGGTTYDASDTTETASLSMGHCKTISVDEVYSFTGTPADSLTLDLSISSFSF